MRPHQVLRKYDGIPIEGDVSYHDYFMAVSGLLSGTGPHDGLCDAIRACWNCNCHRVPAAYSIDIDLFGLEEQYQ